MFDDKIVPQIPEAVAEYEDDENSAVDLEWKCISVLLTS